MKKGESYHFDEYLFSLQKKASRMIKRVNSLPFGNPFRERIFKKLFKNYGENNVIKDNFVCNFGSNISIGDNCYFNHGVTILDSFEVEIGNNVFLAPNVVISAVTHPLVAEKRRELIIKKVTIEDDVWIGTGAVILPGVRIGDNSVIGAGSIVTKDIPSDVVAVGNPCKVLRDISEKDRIYYYKNKEIGDFK